MISSKEVVCCTCARSLQANLETAPYASEKAPVEVATRLPSRTLPCCSREICQSCQEKNQRFKYYCPFCQIHSLPNFNQQSTNTAAGVNDDSKTNILASLPQGLRNPPEYEEPKRDEVDAIGHLHNGVHEADAPPEYTPYDPLQRNQETFTGTARPPDVTHFLHPDDTVASLSLAYSIPTAVLLKHNKLFTSNNLHARRQISIPGTYNKLGRSLSPDPVEDPRETERKARTRRFMMHTKCSEYEVAEFYLQMARKGVERRRNSGDNISETDEGSLVLDQAIAKFKEDEKWERENPLHRNGSNPSGLASGWKTGGRRTGM